MRGILVPVVLVCCAAQGSRADIIAATNMAAGWNTTSFFVGVGYSGSPNFTNETPAQRFEAGASGPVTTVRTRMNRFAGGEPLTVSIYSASGASPGISLGSIVVAEASVPTTESLVTFDLTAQSISLTSGLSYYVVFSTPTALPSNVRYQMDVISPNMGLGTNYQISRSGGAPWDAPSSAGEIPLEVSVVPAPGLALLGWAGLVAVRRRR